MYGNRLTLHGEYLASDQAVPQNTSVDGNGGALRLAGTLGSVEVGVTAASAVTVADGSSLSVRLEESDAKEGPFAYAGIGLDLTASGAPLTFAAGEDLGRIALPSTLKEWTKAVITSDDATASGAIDVWLDFRPR